MILPVDDLSSAGLVTFPECCCCAVSAIDCVSSEADDMERVNRFVEFDDDDGDRTGPNASASSASGPIRFCECAEEEVRVESRIEPARGGKVVLVVVPPPPDEAAVVALLERELITVEKRASPLGGTPLGKNDDDEV